ncbi:HAD family hydrolase [Dysgonomonas macrotermitis]|uniref:Putative hydrolase of the HAD superfamily n=1 Tax=Dysgonomonas macrotermitis TaxID=1346286 RepID=A0A1M5HGV6_9BACT|nr:HAD family hydrolase [Dysgonomonas macrotermitis]SHG15204.1 putative hydrolase of the HAD superfamily [Dysgonomonas macrotermitis]
MKDIQIIGFDADDTLWVNQTYFDEAEYKFRELLSDYLPFEQISGELLKIEIQNMPLLGFGVKAFTISMIEAALKISENKISHEALSQIVEIGKGIMQKPVELLDGVEHVLTRLNGRYKLVVVTKGDLLDQERKLKGSALEHFFHHVEIVSDKQKDDYSKLLKQLDCHPDNFLMIGNSMKSDIVPVLDIGAHAAYVPFHSTWAHEATEQKVFNPRLIRIDTIAEILPYLE